MAQCDAVPVRTRPARVGGIGGLARHLDISAPRRLMAMPLLALFVGDAVAALTRPLVARIGPHAGARLEVAVPLLLTALLAGANPHRFFVVTPSRNPVQPESLWIAGAYSPACRAAGAAPLIVGHARDGPLWFAVTSYEPGRYVPLVLETAEFWRAPAYLDWPSIVLVGSHEQRIVAAVRARNPGARARARRRMVPMSRAGSASSDGTVNPG